MPMPAGVSTYAYACRNARLRLRLCLSLMLLGSTVEIIFTTTIAIAGDIGLAVVFYCSYNWS
jgi:hypothetical protein